MKDRDMKEGIYKYSEGNIYRCISFTKLNLQHTKITVVVIRLYINLCEVET
jgi:hypothetical protein